MTEKKTIISLSWKFAAIILFAGILPLLFFTTAVSRWLSNDYKTTILFSYENAAKYISVSVEAELNSLNDISKIISYYDPVNGEQQKYNYMNYDNLRKMLLAQDVEPQERPAVREKNMETFLRNVYYVDSSIFGAYFVGDSKEWQFEYLGGTSFMEDWEKLRQTMEGYGLDTKSRKLLMLPPHMSEYLHPGNTRVFSVGRNCYDLSSSALDNQPYLGTLLLDIDMGVFSSLVSRNDFGKNSEVYIYDKNKICYYSSLPEFLGANLEEEGLELEGAGDGLTIHVPENAYGLSVTVKLDEDTLYAPIRHTRNLVYIGILCAMCFLIAASSFFAKRLTRPIKGMMTEMAKLERGDFHVSLPVDRRDELGVLSRRFLDMSVQLESYIKQSYVAKLKQNEAEMAALKSQIYPHFLYNTLEIIRMTALEDQDGRKVSRMLEALSKQIHYMIGTVQDFVALEKEADIVEKYVFLLNCRISGEIELVTELNGFAGVSVPKLILQPIVENAYVHGLKPGGGSGTVRITAEVLEQDLVVAVMDDGAGMGREKLEELYALLESDAIGIKREDNWQSIGLKNVHDRVRYLFGERYGIQVTSREKVGTFVRIRMPYKEREECDAENDNRG